MAIIDEIRKTQSETISNHEEKLRRDKNIVIGVVFSMHERIKARVSDYLWAKDTRSMTFKFIQQDLFNIDKYTYVTDSNTKEDFQITRPEYDKVVQTLLVEGFKVSQRDEEEEYYRDGQAPGFGRSIRPVRKLTVEW